MMFKTDVNESRHNMPSLGLSGRSKKVVLIMQCALPLSPAQHPEDGAGALAAAHGTEAARAGGHLQD